MFPELTALALRLERAQARQNERFNQAAGGRSLQKALISARLTFARGRGCDLACASTAPGTASQRSFEACGFRVAYPKVEMAKD